MVKDAVTIDAAGKSLGRVASLAAHYLRGKADPAYQPHILPKMRVLIKNVGRVRFTGKKLGQRYRERYSGYPGGLKKISYETLFKKNPKEFIRNAVAGMIPRNRLRKDILKHLTIYVGDQDN